MKNAKFMSGAIFLAALPALAADAGTNTLASLKLAQSVPIQDKIINYLIENGPKLAGAILIILAGFIAARWVGQFISGWLARKELEPPVRMLITRLTKLFVVAFAAVIALGTMGVNMMAAVTGIGVAGVGVSLAMQGVLSNLVAGLTIIFTKPFRVGEYVEMVGVQGLVEAIELFTTTLTHADRSKVVIPNRKIVGEVLHNYGTIRQLDLTVGVAYNCNVPDAVATVRDILKQNPRILKELTPGVGISTLADSSIVLSVKPWVKVSDYGPAGPEIYQAILDRFKATRVEIPYPQREIRVLNGAGHVPA
jgi:small conductance mechanosensitive channel